MNGPGPGISFLPCSPQDCIITSFMDQFMGSRGGRGAHPSQCPHFARQSQWGNVGASCERALHVLPSLRPVGHEDAKGEPDGRYRVATDDVAEVMCAEVDPAEPDEQDQDR
jgi:hypothetical protein